MDMLQKGIQFVRHSPLHVGIVLVAIAALAIAAYAFVMSRTTAPPAHVAPANSAPAHDNIPAITNAPPTSVAAAPPAADSKKPTPPTASDLSDPQKKEIAMQLVSAAENSSLDWKAQYAYIEYNVEGNSSENRGYTAGIVGFTSKTADMLELVQYYKQIAPGNVLEKYMPALQAVNGSSSDKGLGAAFVRDWQTAANASDGLFRQAQDHERDRVYFNPAVTMAKQDGLGALGQFAYYDTAVMHGAESGDGGLPDIRAAATKKAKTPAQGGDEQAYLAAFLDARKAEMQREEAHSETGRVDTLQQKFLNDHNLDLTLPLTFGPIYNGDPVFTIK